MENILKRKMFSIPKRDHRGTGIASGLAYRPGYRVGGRVGFKHGGNHSDIFDTQYKKINQDKQLMEEFNPDLQSSLGETSFEGIGDSDIKLSTLGEDKKFVETMKGIETLINENNTPINYSEFAPTGTETIQKGLTSAYDKLYGEPIPAGTIGSPSTVGTLVNEITKAAQEASATRKELDLLGKTEKKADKKAATEKALDLASNIYATDIAALDASQKNQIALSLGISSQQLEKYLTEQNMSLQDMMSQRDIQFGYDQLLSQLNISMSKMQTDLTTAQIAATADTAQMKELGQLTNLKNDDGSFRYTMDEAISLVYKTQNSQLDFASALMSALSSGQMGMGDPTEAVAQAFEIMQGLFGNSLNINMEQIQNILNTSNDVFNPNEEVERMMREGEIEG